MENAMKRWVLGVWCCIVLSGVGMEAGAVSLSVDTDPGTVGIQSSATVLPGDTLTVALVVAGIVDDPANLFDGLQAFELDLAFNPLVLTATSVVSGGFLVPPTFVVENDTTAPDVNFAEVHLGISGAFGTGTLATVTFNVIGFGGSILDLNDVILSQPFGVPLLPVTLDDGNVNAVPEPGTFLLFGTGLAGLVGWRYRKRRKPSRIPTEHAPDIRGYVY